MLAHRPADTVLATGAAPGRLEWMGVGLTAAWMLAVATSAAAQAPAVPEPVDVVIAHARSLHAVGRYGDAAIRFREAAERTADPSLWVWVAECELGGRHVPAAIRASWRAVGLAPEHAGFRASLGDVLAEAHRDAEARSQYARALELEPTSERARAGLVMLDGGERPRLLRDVAPAVRGPLVGELAAITELSRIGAALYASGGISLAAGAIGGIATLWVGVGEAFAGNGYTLLHASVAMWSVALTGVLLLIGGGIHDHEARVRRRAWRELAGDTHPPANSSE